MALWLVGGAAGAQAATVSGIAVRNLYDQPWLKCNGSTSNVSVAVNGALVGSGTCNASSGAFTVTIGSPAVGQIVAVYLNDGVAGNDGVTYLKVATAGANITGVRLALDEARLGGTSNTTFTTANLATWDSTKSAQVPLTVASGALTTQVGGFVIDTGDRFNPTGAVTVARLWIMPSATYGGTTETLRLTGSGIGDGCDTSTSAKPLCIDSGGTFTPPAITRFEGSGLLEVQGPATYAVLQLQPASGTPSYLLGGSGVGTVTVASLVVGDGVIPVEAYVDKNNVMVTGAVQVAAGSQLSDTNGAGVFQAQGDVTGAGKVSFVYVGTFEHRPSTAAATLNATTVPWVFGSYAASTSFLGGMSTITIPSTSKKITFYSSLDVGRIGDSQVTRLDATGVTAGLLVAGDMTITSRGQFDAPPVLDLYEDFTNRGTFVHNSGTANVSGDPAITSNIRGSTTFANLIVAATKFAAFEAGATTTVNGLFQARGFCGDEGSIGSTVPGSRWNLVIGGTTSIANEVITDSNVTTPVTVTGVDGGNNLGWTFAPTTCAAPTLPFIDKVDASVGSANPTTIAGASPFHMSLKNVLGDPADRHHTRVWTTPLSDALALWRLDGDGSDLSAANIAAVAPSLPTTPTYVSGRFPAKQAARFDGIDDRLDIPYAAVHRDSTFTIEAWIRTSSIANATTPTIVSRGASATTRHFELAFDSASGELRGSSSLLSGPIVVTTPAAPIVNGAWHHVALAADGSTLRMLVDGVQVASTPMVGAVAPGFTGASIGGTANLSTAFAGDIADVRLAGRPMTTGDVAGYVATQLPHATLVWETGAATGAAFSVKCNNNTRCNDVVYGGPSLDLQGARWYVDQRLRTPLGSWTRWSVPDWFETSSTISIAAIAPVAMTGVLPGTDATGTTSISTTCGEASGCILYASAASGTVALTNGSGSSIPPFVRIQPLAPGPWTPGAVGGFGISVLSTTSGKDTSRWGAGTLQGHTGTLKYAGLDPTPIPLATRPGTGVETTVLTTRLNASAGTVAGSYTGTIDIIALAAAP